MKPIVSNQKTGALTLVEVVVVLVVVIAVGGLVFSVLMSPARDQAQRKSRAIDCVINLKQIGLATRVWGGDHNDKYPTQVSVTNGGAMEAISAGNVWINFLAMSNEIGSTKVLVCPQDAKHQPPATNFSEIAGHISYFVGLDATEANPQSILSGDDNFETPTLLATSHLLELASNALVGWASDRHGLGGNLLFSDGHVESVVNLDLVKQFRQTGLATNRLAIP